MSAQSDRFVAKWAQHPPPLDGEDYEYFNPDYCEVDRIFASDETTNAAGLQVCPDTYRCPGGRIGMAWPATSAHHIRCDAGRAVPRQMALPAVL